MNRIYSVHVQVNNKKGYPVYTNYFYAYNLNKAIELGKIEFIRYYNNHKSKFSKISFSEYMNKLDYCFFIDIISGNRIEFNSYKDLKYYFDSNILNISNNELYDFLLSLIDFIYTAYDYNGNLIDLDGHINYINDLSSYDIKFTEDECKNGIYKFDIRGNKENI